MRHPLVQKSFRHMMIMKISRLQRLQESRGRAIEKGCITNINFISILALSFVLCLLGDVYPDEWICMGFLDIIFYMLLLFELEYERNTLQLSNNSRTDYLRFTFAFIICSVVCIISGFMPLYSRPVMIFLYCFV